MSQVTFPFTKDVEEQNKITEIISNIDKQIEKTSMILEKISFLKKGTREKLFRKGISHKKFKKSKVGFLRKHVTIPEGWDEDDQLKKLNSLTEDIGDGIHSTPEYVPESDYYFINGNNLSNGSIVFTDKTKMVSKQEYEKYYIKFDENTVFLSLNGTIGNLSFFNNEKVILGKSVCYIKCNKELDAKFLFYFLESELAKKFYESEQTQTSIPNLSLTSVRKMPIPTPSLPEQKEISSILEMLDTKKELELKTKSKLENLKKGLIVQLLTGQLRVKL